MIHIFFYAMLVCVLIAHILEERQYIIVKPKDLVGSDCKIKSTLDNNGYTVTVIVEQEVKELIVYSKNWMNYQIGDTTKIVEYSDGLYFLL